MRSYVGVYGVVWLHLLDRPVEGLLDLIEGDGEMFVHRCVRAIGIAGGNGIKDLLVAAQSGVQHERIAAATVPEE